MAQIQSAASGCESISKKDFVRAKKSATEKKREQQKKRESNRNFELEIEHQTS
jgi:hypothetical protein